MATALERKTAGATTGSWASVILPILVLVLLTAWAGTAGQDGAPEVHHASPGTVEPVEGSDRSVVTLTPDGADKIGLDVVRVERTSHPAGRLAVPDAALVQGADGTIWVYASAGHPLRFRRQVVEVEAVTGQRAILSRGPRVGTTIAGTGSAELYGTETEVGH